MTYYPDLSPFEYGSIHVNMDGDVVNVGWLDAAHDYQKGDVSDAFLDRLWTFCQWSVLQARGYHACNLCQPIPYQEDEIFIGQYGDEIVEVTSYQPLIKIQRGDEIVKLGNAQLRVFGLNDRVYAAPNLIYHYVTEHRYQPPMEFIEAVLRSPLPNSPEYEARVEKYAWWHHSRLMQELSAGRKPDEALIKRIKRDLFK